MCVIYVLKGTPTRRVRALDDTDAYKSDVRVKELTYLAWGDCDGGVGVIRFSVNPLHTRIISLVQTIEDSKMPERRFVLTDLTNQLVDGVFARHLPDIHPLEVKQVILTRCHTDRRHRPDVGETLCPPS